MAAVAKLLSKESEDFAVQCVTWTDLPASRRVGSPPVIMALMRCIVVVGASTLACSRREWSG
jgi:hypothetical protein